MANTTQMRPKDVFEEYLTALGLRFTYKAPIGEHRADVLVHSAVGDVLCEVTDVERNDEDQAVLEGITSSRDSVGSSKIPFHPIQLRIRAFSSQFGEYKNRSPRLLVLVDAPGHGGLCDFTVLSAMYGIAPIGGPIQQDDEDDYSDPSFGFGRASRYLTRLSNTAVSAVAILEYVSPSWRPRKQALDQQDFGHGSERLPTMTKFLHELGEQNPEIFRRVPRLRVFRNVFAATPWPAAALLGPHDLLWPSEDSR